MLLYLDNKNRIMAVNSTDRTDLTEIKVDETDEMFPFTGWSDVRICCYKIGYTTDEDGVSHINMMTPYVPTHMMSAIDSLENKNEKLENNQIDLKAENEELATTMDVLLTELIPSLLSESE